MKRYKKNASPSQLSSLIKKTLPPGTTNRIKFEKVKKEWPRIVGPRLASSSCVTSMERGVVFVCASSPPAAQNVQMKSRALLSVLREVWGLEITEIKVFVGSVRKIPSEASPERSSPRIRLDAHAISREREKISVTIEDPRLSAALASLKVTLKTRFGEKADKNKDK